MFITDPGQKLVWFKTIAFNNGISPSEFRKCRLSDIQEIMAMKTALSNKATRTKNVQNLINQMRFK